MVSEKHRCLHNEKLLKEVLIGKNAYELYCSNCDPAVPIRPCEECGHLLTIDQTKENLFHSCPSCGFLNIFDGKIRQLLHYPESRTKFEGPHGITCVGRETMVRAQLSIDEKEYMERKLREFEMISNTVQAGDNSDDDEQQHRWKRQRPNESGQWNGASSSTEKRKRYLFHSDDALLIFEECQAIVQLLNSPHELVRDPRQLAADFTEQHLQILRGLCVDSNHEDVQQEIEILDLVQDFFLILPQCIEQKQKLKRFQFSMNLEQSQMSKPNPLLLNMITVQFKRQKILYIRFIKKYLQLLEDMNDIIQNISRKLVLKNRSSPFTESSVVSALNRPSNLSHFFSGRNASIPPPNSAISVISDHALLQKVKLWRQCYVTVNRIILFQ